MRRDICTLKNNYFIVIFEHPMNKKKKVSNVKIISIVYDRI